MQVFVVCSVFVVLMNPMMVVSANADREPGRISFL
jgi:hypothetical protein